MIGGQQLDLGGGDDLERAAPPEDRRALLGL